MEELEKIAREDPMTGIANRRRFFEVANPLFDDAKKQGVSFYLFVFDLDNFKAINDTYGHDVGDEVIKAFVAAVQAHLDKNDCFARVGGDEFILVLYGMKKEEAIAKIDRIRKTVSKTRVSKMQISFAVSIGAAKLKPDDISIDAVFKRADNGLYKAKRISRESTRGQA
jgi:diguanylate cyclase (GGDEF)-like protein